MGVLTHVQNLGGTAPQNLGGHSPLKIWEGSKHPKLDAI